jgi:ATP-dependent helicase HrpB
LRDRYDEDRGAREFHLVLREARALSRLLQGGVEAPADEDTLLKCVLAGYPDRVARRRQAGARHALMTGGVAVELDRESAVLESELFVAVEVTRVGGSGRHGRVRLASGIEPEWLAEIHPALARQENETIWNEERQSAEGRRRWLHMDLCWKERSLDRPDPEQAAELLARAGTHPRFLEELLRGGRLEQTLLRIECLRELRPDLELPASDEETLAGAVRAACPGRSSLEELREAPWEAILIKGLGPEASALLARWCPPRIRLPSGREAPIVYRKGQSPLVSAKLQEFFGTRQSPRIAEGRRVVAVDLLAPNGRSVQITTDLASFWENLYPRERRELGRRYPRHPWPEDPIQATPSARPLPRSNRNS